MAPLPSVSKGVIEQKFLREDEFDLYGSERAAKTNFQRKGFTRRLVLTDAKEGNGLILGNMPCKLRAACGLILLPL